MPDVQHAVDLYEDILKQYRLGNRTPLRGDDPNITDGHVDRMLPLPNDNEVSPAARNVPQRHRRARVHNEGGEGIIFDVLADQQQLLCDSLRPGGVAIGSKECLAEFSHASAVFWGTGDGGQSGVLVRSMLARVMPQTH